MWNRLRASILVESFRSSKEIIYKTVGWEAFRNSLRLCGSIPLEVTIPNMVSSFEEFNFTSLKIDRLNFYDIRYAHSYDWSTLSSPRHLWAGNGESHFICTRMLPSSLISRTTTITIHNITVTTPKGSNRITQLVLCGVQATFKLTSLLESLPCLAELDAGHAMVCNHREQDHRALTHQNLKHLRIPISCMRDLEEYLAGGLQLPSLNCFGLANHSVSEILCNGPLRYTPSAFPSVSAQFSTTVTHLEVHGEFGVTTSSTSSLIETFYKIDTISTYGGTVRVILRALCRTGDMPEGEKASEKESLPSSIQALHIHDYFGDGEDLYPALHQIYNGTEPIKIFFENCPNILPTTRREFTHMGTAASRPSH